MRANNNRFTILYLSELQVVWTKHVTQRQQVVVSRQFNAHNIVFFFSFEFL